MRSKSSLQDLACLQESFSKKQRWLSWVKQRYPIGARVEVIALGDEDPPEYLGQKGTVAGYDLGDSGEWPYLRVQLDDGTTDLFEDEVEVRRTEGMA